MSLVETLQAQLDQIADQTWSVADAADDLEISPEAVRMRLHRQQLEAVRFGSAIRIVPATP